MPRYTVKIVNNGNTWYEIYSDGFIRQGMKFSNTSPLVISTPQQGEIVNFPISFSKTIFGIHMALNAGTDNALEFPGYVSESLQSMRVLSQGISNGSSATTSYLKKFIGYIIVEGY
ncbi:hypothetical protein C7M52_00031 [Mixta theicola]|nr:hypothetical protein C7M52_00031 [Mixta theicola]